MKKCRIVRYDIITPPFKVDVVDDEFECERPEEDEGGVKFYFILSECCVVKGYTLKSYCNSRVPEYDYDVAVI